MLAGAPEACERPQVQLTGKRTRNWKQTKRTKMKQTSELAEVAPSQVFGARKQFAAQRVLKPLCGRKKCSSWELKSRLCGGWFNNNSNNSLLLLDNQQRQLAQKQAKQTKQNQAGVLRRAQVLRSPASGRTSKSARARSRPLGVATCLLLGALATLTSITEQATSQELGEGLTLGGARAPADQQQQQQQQPWPFSQHQLDKLRSEAGKVSALVGQNVILNCAVQFADGQEKPFVVNWLKYPHKLPIYIWYAGYPPHVAQGYENRVARLGQASLNLSQVRETDQGLYECKIYYLERGGQHQAQQQRSGTDEHTNGTWIFLDVQAPPHFTQSPPPISYVQAGDSLRLPCQAQSTPAPILRWYKNKVPIDAAAGPYRLLSASAAAGDDNERHQQQPPQATIDSVQLDLFIDNIQAGQTTGDYVCLASNSEGSIEARSQVVLAIPAVITTMPRNQTRLEGERVELQCQAKALPANITYKWLFNDKPLQQLKWFDSRFTVRQRDGTLVIHSVHRDDQGQYKCQATNGLAHRSQQSSEAQSEASKGGANVGAHKPAPIYAEAAAYLQVEYPARVTYSPAIQYLPLGLAGQIRCFVQAAPQVEFFTWTLNNQQFDPNADPNIERLTNGSLLIKQVSKRYEGKYRCTPFNKHGSAGSSSAMEVLVEEPPQFDLRPAEFYKANLNGELKISCDARGSPKPSVSWRRVSLLSGTSATSASGQQLERTRRKANRWPNYDQQPNGANKSSTRILPIKRLAKRRLLVKAEASNRQAPHLAYDEAADEPDETHQFYAQTSSTSSSLAGLGEQTAVDTQAYSSNQVPASRKQDELQQQASTAPVHEQPTVIVSYSKLPSDRSEYKNSYLYLHALKKEDHGRYECVIENEVASLVASTMVYIEETTPHAPTDVRVDTKAWSAQVSWTPGYDGGFEQSFVVWYRQVERSTKQQQQTAASPTLTGGQHASSRELIDINWHSANVQPSDATSFNVQNLSQDTSYEFYVRAKNIIGEGPRSQVIQASTKRAMSGSVTPISAGGLEPADVAASTSPQDELLASTHTAPYDPNEEDGEPATVTTNGGQASTSIRPYLIIHPEFVQPSSVAPSEPSLPTKVSNGSSQAATEQQQQQQIVGETQGGGENQPSNKVIRIYFPAPKQQADGAHQPNGSKRTRTEQRQAVSSGNSSEAANSTSTLAPLSGHPVDYSTAPQNLSMAKVAQGWVLSWQPPQRVPEFELQPAHEEAMLQRQALAQQNQQQQPKGLPAALSQIDETATVQSLGSSLQRLEPAAVAVYSIELKEKNSAQWNTLATAREHSLLLKDLRPGSEYSFRVVAHSINGAKGTPSPEFKYQIHDNRRKPGSTQAMSAGVVSGILFFIACIVIAVCGVNMCNKRRKKRAEKAAYVMMACPVLESHHDLTALNSNSLMKNSSGAAIAAQGRVSSLASYPDEERNRNSLIGSLGKSGQAKLLKALLGTLQKCSPSAASSPNGLATLKESNCERNASCGEQERSIDFSSTTDNEPFPAHVEERHQEQQQRRTKLANVVSLKSLLPVSNKSNTASTSSSTTERAQHGPTVASVVGALAMNKPAQSASQRTTPLDDYWIRQPSDRKWGTLTLAASKLAERRAQAEAIARDPNGFVGRPSREMVVAAGHHHQTLPRSFRSAPSAPMRADASMLTALQQRQMSPPVPPRRLAAAAVATQVNGAASSQAPALPLHKRSVSHVEASHWRQQQQQAAGGAVQWWWQPSAEWQRQTPMQDFASMSFGPPAELVAPGCNNANGRSWQHLTPTIWWPAAGGCDQQQQQQDDVPSPSFGKRNSLARSTLPMAAQPANPSQPGWTVLAPPYNPAHDQRNSTANDDDPLLGQNACFGSYKRKRRLPSIEARFTITPCDQLDGNREQSELGAGRAPPRPPRNERDALQSGQLFVRELAQPAGLPQSGQRTEALISRVTAHGLVPPVETIGSREKIETFLRNQQVVFEQPDNSLMCGEPPIEVDQVDELTFQPYYNLPSLKYSISLPLRRASDGTLLIQATSHLRPRKRLSLNKMITERENNGGGNLLCLARPKPSVSDIDEIERRSATLSRLRCERRKQHQQQTRRRLRLGSSSSCPASGGARQLENQAGSSGAAARMSNTDRRSLEGALGDPTLANRPEMERRAPLAQDSLERVGDYRELKVAREQRAPPVPPHRRQFQIKARGSNEESQTSSATTNGSSSERHSSPASTSTTSTSSTSTSASTSASSSGHCNRGDKSEPTTTSTNNDNHSVDGHYEFDQVSNCSSSKTGALRRRMDRIEHDNNNGKGKVTATTRQVAKKEITTTSTSIAAATGAANSPAYTKVDKSKKRQKRLPLPAAKAQMAPNGLTVLERTRFYDDKSRKKEQTLIGLGFRREVADNGNLYDTVCESAPLTPDVLILERKL